MRLSALRSTALAASVTLAIGCPTSPTPTSDAGSDGGSAAAPVSLAMTIHEFGTASPVVGASIVVGEVTRTTDGSGQVTVMLPANATSAIGVSQPGFPDHLLYETVLEADLSATYDLGSDTTIAALAAALMLTRDPSKGQLSVGVLDGTPGGASRLAGATIRIDADRDAQLVFDSSASSGFSPGDTTLAGSSSASIFVNVVPGVVTPTITPPSGYTCDLGPATVEVAAEGYTIVNHYCHR